LRLESDTIMNIEQIEKLLIEALTIAKQIHEELGETGKQIVQKNRFGDTALRIDIEIENAILGFLKKLQIPIRVVSEENGTVEICKNPIYLGILDGLDGTNVYKKSRGTGRYGTMFGIYSNTYPLYNDYLSSGIVEHSRNCIFFASKGTGSFLKCGNKVKSIHCSEKNKINKNTKIYIDEFFDINIKIFSEKLYEFNTKCLGSSSIYYVDLVSGDADLVLECTRKGNLEIAVAYGILVEAGGVMTTLDGDDLGPMSYFDFGQQEYLPIISACTDKLGKSLIKILEK
jgi:fructose-1,6-bisphosphatase/inositol monophosphatase family enzyme